MKIKYLLIFIGLFFLSNTYAYNYNIDFNSSHYYEEQIDVGISDLNNTEINNINITVFSSYETYLNYDYSIDEIKEVPLVFNKQVSSDINILYSFFNINDNLIETQEHSLKLQSAQEIPEFYLCKEENCNINEIRSGYYFNLDEDTYIVTDLGQNYNKDQNYNIEISALDAVLLAENNVSFPYFINKNQILGRGNYKLRIEIIDTNQSKFIKELFFELSNYTKSENLNIIQNHENLDTIQDIQEDGEQIIAEEPIQISNPPATSKVKTNPTKINYYWISIIIVIVIIIFLILIFSKKSTNRRLTRNESNRGTHEKK